MITSTRTGRRPAGRRRPRTVAQLRVALAITLFVVVVEIVGGVLADSLALIADAAHYGDGRPGSRHGAAGHSLREPGRRATGEPSVSRAPRSAALANCLLLLGVGGYVLYEAIERFITPAGTAGGLTVVFGAIGLVANMVSLTLLMRGQKESLNVRGAFLEVAGGRAGNSLAVIISALVILATGWQPADPIASLVIGLMIVPRTWRLLRETLDVLLEAAPGRGHRRGARPHTGAGRGRGRPRPARLDHHLGPAGAVGARGGDAARR